MRRDHRFQLALGLAVGASLAFLAFLLARPVSDEAVRLTANLAQLLAPVVAASAAAWAVGQATWVWYEHLARRELPFPSLADVGYLGAIPLAAAAMLAFPGRAERAALQARSLLGGGRDRRLAALHQLGAGARPGVPGRRGRHPARAGPQPRGRGPGRRPHPGGHAPRFPLQGRHVRVGANVGVTVSEATEVDAVLREADVAMYLAKARGKGRFELASNRSALDTVGTIPET